MLKHNKLGVYTHVFMVKEYDKIGFDMNKLILMS